MLPSLQRAGPTRLHELRVEELGRECCLSHVRTFDESHSPEQAGEVRSREQHPKQFAHISRLDTLPRHLSPPKQFVASLAARRSTRTYQRLEARSGPSSSLPSSNPNGFYVIKSNVHQRSLQHIIIPHKPLTATTIITTLLL